jgi:hypothetical protein
MESITVEDVLQAVQSQLKRIEKSNRGHSPITEVKKKVEQENSATI